MNATRGINNRNKVFAGVLGSLLLLTAMFITGCDPVNSGGTTNTGNGNQGNANTGNGNSGNGNSSEGNAGGDSGNSGGSQVDYMYPAQGYVEVLQLNVDNAGDVTGSQGAVLPICGEQEFLADLKREGYTSRNAHPAEPNPTARILRSVLRCMVQRCRRQAGRSSQRREKNSAGAPW